MKIAILPEPELEFGNGGRHEDIRFGIMNYGLLNRGVQRQEIRVGIVGTGASIEGAQSWLERCRVQIEAKASSHRNLFPLFPGISSDSCFQLECVVPSRGIGQMSDRAVNEAMASGGDKAIASLGDLFSDELKRVDEREHLDVVICSVPNSALEPKTESDSAAVPNINFRGYLKAKAMDRRFPIQLLLPVTYGAKGKRTIVGAAPGTHQQERTQDEATRAWNFFTALIYKARIPLWRLVRSSTSYESCFVGVSFYRSLDSTRMLTSMAQVFNERGEGMVVRGDPVELSDDDLQPHLKEDDARKLLKHALAKYRSEHRHLPARVVLHKTTVFNKSETDGFSSAIKESNVDLADFLSVAKSGTRLYRHGKYPALRGTYLQLDPLNHLLYTRGSSEFYETYTGMYVPRALLFRSALADSGPEALAGEILALTKLNWNSTQIDGAAPITVRAARRVAEVLKYVSDENEPRADYSYYM